MNKNLLLKKIFTQKVQDYTFSILFLLIFSVFIVFAIRPSLSTAFSLSKDEKDLREIDNLYEKQIYNIITIQSLFEKLRNKTQLFDQTISIGPNSKKIFIDIKKAADENGLIIENLQSGVIDLKYAQNKSLKKIKISLKGTGNFENIQAFIKELFNQRRLKSISQLQIKGEKSESATQSASLGINFNIEGYYE